LCVPSDPVNRPITPARLVPMPTSFVRSSDQVLAAARPNARSYGKALPAHTCDGPDEPGVGFGAPFE
jgi:hypothetical protein